ncbi:MAG: cytidylyltransferase family protein [Desulfurococcales archaeon]|nr:cytidylyltransferase family protein [Desulfurococcales archaeon]
MELEINVDRIRHYIDGLETSLNRVSRLLSNRYPGLLDAIKRYVNDSRYYLEKGDAETSLVSVAYAEGLLDSLKYIGELEIQWPERKQEKRVFLAGTFDIIHPGHIELMKWASGLGKLYVVVARDANVLKSKGRLPVLSESIRLRIVQGIRYVYDARLGDEADIFAPIEDIRPDIIALGPDQAISEEVVAGEVERRLGYRPVVTRYPAKKAFNGIKSSTDIIELICKNYCDLIKV